MVFWHLAATDDQAALTPPSLPNQCGSVVSTASRDSMWTLSSDSKLPSSTRRTPSLSMRLVGPTPSIPLRVLSMSVHLLTLILPTQPRLALVSMVKPIILFSLMSSISITVHLILVMIPSGKRLTSGIRRLAMWSGTIHVSSIPPMVPFTSESKTLLQMGCRIALACFRVGTSYVSRAGTLRSLLLFPVPTRKLAVM
jgi:hypothetical protein